MYKNEKVNYFFITINVYDISFRAIPIVLFMKLLKKQKH
jgi:hypothetical protein